VTRVVLAKLIEEEIKLGLAALEGTALPPELRPSTEPNNTKVALREGLAFHMLEVRKLLDLALRAESGPRLLGPGR
jgi:hypothetical protein